MNRTQLGYIKSAAPTTDWPENLAPVLICVAIDVVT
jgi:hypothetical protein